VNDLGTGSRDGRCRSRVTPESAAARGFILAQGQPADAEAMAELFLECFPDSVRRIFGRRRPRPDAMADFFSFVIRVEPEAVHTARPDGGDDDPPLAGYAIVTRHMPRLWSTAALTGAWIPWLFRFLTGRYGVGFEAVPRLLAQKLAFVATFRPAHRSAAQVLSLAVAPAYQGRGLGKLLLAHGLDYLRRRKVATVKLEVLQDNLPAMRLYRAIGFLPVGEMPDGRRRWIVMQKKLRAT